MKKITYLFSLAAAAVILSLVLNTGCEGPAGINGIDGVDGIAGTNGINGQDGAEGTASCKTCHSDDTDLLAKSIQAAGSGHMTGGHFRYADQVECSVCHTHEGFMEIMGTTNEVATTAFEEGTPPNCRTCHKIHDTYTTDDYALRVTGAVTLWYNDAVVDLGTSNMCVGCHQMRMPLVPLATVGGGNVTLTSSSWGPHQNQSPTVWGTGGYETAGSSNYPTPGSTGHAGAGCVGCHMVMPGRGDQAGGHTMSMFYESRSTLREFTTSCDGCHDGADFDYMDIQTDVTALWDSLEAILTAKNILLDGDINASTAVPLTVTSDEAGAIMNLNLVDTDKTSGIHNPRYTKALLKNSIAAMSK